MSANDDNQSLTGQTIRRNVRIGPRLGRGAMGEVYLAEESHLQRSVAVKVIRPSVLGDERFSKAFFNEARIISQLRHPNIVSLLDFGETEKGMLYLIMEYIPGRPLSRALATDGTEDPFRIANILGQVADALEVAHVAGVIHRDIKPDNILVEELPSGYELAKLLDFGLASRTISGDGDAVTRGKVVGAPAFMSPEQARAAPVTPRSDVFSLGAVLMLLLAGCRIYEGSTVRQVLKRASAGEVLDPSKIRPELDDDPELRALAAVCRRATQPDPYDRYASAAAFGTAIRATLSDSHRKSARSFVQHQFPIQIDDESDASATSTLRIAAEFDASMSTQSIAQRDWFDDTIRGRGSMLQFRVDTPESTAALVRELEAGAKRRGLLFLAPREPSSCCHVGELIAECIERIEVVLDAKLDEWPDRLDLQLRASDLLRRYCEGWRYEATHPVLFEVSDAGLVHAFRSLLESLCQSVPILLVVRVPSHPDPSVRMLVQALTAMDGTHPLMVAVAAANELISLPHHSFKVTDSIPGPAPVPQGSSSATLPTLTTDVRNAAEQGKLDWLEELLVEVSGAVPIEYLGESAHRLWDIALRALPSSSLSDSRARAWHIEGARAALRSGRQAQAREWIVRVDSWSLRADEAVIVQCVRAQLTAAENEEMAAMEAVGDLRKRLAQQVYPVMTRLQVLMDLTRLIFQFGPNVLYRDQLCERLLRELEEIVDDPLIPSPIVHRGVEALLTVVAHGREADARHRAVEAVNSLLRRALPARLEIAVFRTLVRQQYLHRGILSPQDAKAMLVRAADVSRRTGDPTSQYDILWLTADVHVHEGQPADANRVLYQALKIAELLHWPDRMQATIERIASLAGVDADQTVG